MSCFFNKILPKKSFKRLEDHLVVCTKACYKLAVTTKHCTWDNYGCNGKDDPITSVSLLIHWMTTRDNYSRMRKGKNNGGKSKDKVAEMIAAHINSFNVHCPRKGKNIISKMQQLQ
jgi:hypothetical protein